MRSKSVAIVAALSAFISVGCFPKAAPVERVSGRLGEIVKGERAGGRALDGLLAEAEAGEGRPGRALEEVGPAKSSKGERALDVLPAEAGERRGVPRTVEELIRHAADPQAAESARTLERLNAEVERELSRLFDMAAQLPTALREAPVRRVTIERLPDGRGDGATFRILEDGQDGRVTTTNLDDVMGYLDQREGDADGKLLDVSLRGFEEQGVEGFATTLRVRAAGKGKSPTYARVNGGEPFPLRGSSPKPDFANARVNAPREQASAGGETTLAVSVHAPPREAGRRALRFEVRVEVGRGAPQRLIDAIKEAVRKLIEKILGRTQTIPDFQREFLRELGALQREKGWPLGEVELKLGAGDLTIGRGDRGHDFAAGLPA
jgi:hypothetical protein